MKSAWLAQRVRLAALGRHARRFAGWTTLLTLFTLACGSLLLLRYGALPAASFLLPTQILDADDNVIATLQHGADRQFANLEHISPWLAKATVAVEDRRFFSHTGIDFQGLARAAFVDLRHLSKKQGASTLTQQLARNLFLNHERTWRRKLKEALYTAQLERKYNKRDILALYLNQVYYGHGAYGAEAAARLYYGKSAEDLSLAESAMLAGLPRGPRHYSPYLHADAAEERRQTVLEAMRETGAVTDSQAAWAVEHPAVVRPLPEDQDRIAPYFVDYVKKIATEQLGIDERLINEGGLVIRTTLDTRMQREAETAMQGGLAGGSAELQSALLSLDPRNGYVKAMVGGRSYKQNQYNRVFTHTRQPGSSFKPILYAAALERNAITPATQFRSEPTLFYFDEGRQLYRPGNYNNRYFNEEIGLRRAIAASDNVYAVNAIMRTGPESVIDMARRLGIASELKAVPSLALGTFPVSPYEMATAFSVFAAEGKRVEPVAIRSIRSRDGKLLYEYRPRSEQAISPALSYVVTRLLESVLAPGGTGHRISGRLTRPVAGKTGTTDSDAWFAGYTPQLTTVVWVGYDKGRPITSSEAHRAAPIFAAYTEAALAGTEPQAFAMPEGVVAVRLDPATGLVAPPPVPQSSEQRTVIGEGARGRAPKADGYWRGSDGLGAMASHRRSFAMGRKNEFWYLYRPLLLAFESTICIE